MILRDGTDTREEAASLGRYCDGMAVILAEMARDSSYEDDFAGDFCVTGTATRFGRRILRASTDGFLWSETYPSLEAAEAAMVEAHTELDNPDDEDGAW